MTDRRASDLCDITSGLFSKLEPWRTLAQDIAENFYPLRADFTTDFTLGHDFAGTVMDGYTINTRETLGNAIDSMLRQGDWFKVGTGDEERDQRAVNAIALERATKALRTIVRRPLSNFSQATKEADMDWVAFGTAITSVEESRDRTGLIFRAWHPKSVAWMLNEYGRPDRFHRRYMETARNIKKNFDSGKWKGTLARELEDACKKEPNREFPLAHVLMPVEDIYGDDKAKRRKLRHKFVSLYIDETHREILNEAGSPVQNYVVSRWRTLAGVAPGFSPAAINSLPDSRMLQDMARVILEQGEKAVDPPMIGAADVFTRDINLYSGGFTHVDLPEGGDLRNAMTVVETGQGIPTGLQMKQDVRMLLADAWLLNKLFLPNVREMRELEVATRNEEFRRAALPFFTPIESEYHSPLLGAAFEMAVNMRLVNPEMFPEELQGEDIEFTFDSPLKEAEGQKVVAAYQQSMQIIAAGSQVEPELASQFDVIEATIDAVRGSGANPEWILPEDVRKQKKQSAEQMKEAQRMAGAVQQGAAVAQQVGAGAMALQQAGLEVPA